MLAFPTLSEFYHDSSEDEIEKEEEDSGPSSMENSDNFTRITPSYFTMLM